jgi:hypothetical protein
VRGTQIEGGSGGDGGSAGSSGGDKPTECSIKELGQDVVENVRDSVWNSKNHVSLALTFEGMSGSSPDDNFDRRSVSIGVNTALQSFVDLRVPSYDEWGRNELHADGAALAGSAGLNLGLSGPVEANQGWADVYGATAAAFVGVGGSISTTNDGTDVSVPYEVRSARLGRLSGTGGIGLVRYWGREKTYTNATAPWFGLLSRPRGWTGCGGRIE